jgi:hypothetical protein
MVLWSTLGGFLLGVLGGSDLEDLANLRRSIREATAGAAQRKTEAHLALDQGQYDKAAEDHRQSLRKEREAAELSRSEKELVERIARSALELLDDDAVEIRDRGSATLVALGPAAIPLLKRLEPLPSVESQRRMEDALARLDRIEMDSEGRFHQWAQSARASSEYTGGSWSAMQATGKPDTMSAGDAPTAWASLLADGGIEWLELTYENAVTPELVRVRETFNPGAVVRLEVLDPEGAWRQVWEGKDTTRDCPGWLELPVPALPYPIRTIRVILDTASVPGWNEIDAVEVVGAPAPLGRVSSAERAREGSGPGSRR